MCWLVGCLVGHLSGWVCFALFYFLLLFSVSFLSFLFFFFFFFTCLFFLIPLPGKMGAVD